MDFMANPQAKGLPFSRLGPAGASQAPEPVSKLLLTTRWQ
jgi:hypothetical protein